MTFSPSLGRGWPALLLTVVLAFAFAGAAPGSAKAWWQKDWPYRKAVTVDTSAKGVEIKAPIGRAPLLLRLHSGNFRFDDAAQDGSDLRFVAADDKTVLTYHIEAYDPLLGMATIWLDLRDFPVGASQSIWMYYGNKKATAAVNTAGVFDPDYVAVFHFDAAAGVPPKDKTAYGNNAQTAPAAVDDAAVIGRGARFIGQGPMLVGASPSLAVPAGGPFTVSAWVKPDAGQGAPSALLARRSGGLVIGLEGGAPFVQLGGQKIAASAPLPPSQWSHLAVVADGHAVTLYVNGAPAGTGPAASPALDGPLALGGDVGGPLAGFQGELDEVRLSKVARPAALVRMDAASQGADSKLVAFGADEKQSGFGFGYFGVILRSVTVDAWAVIAILLVMAAASWYVMWTKAAYVGAVDRANDQFLQAFGDRADDPLALARHGEAAPFQKSSIYRVYGAGARDILRRLSTHHAVGLTPEGLQVVRALMDAAYVRESQRLSKGLVLLTIAISGGPFLGLLGTVVGVMITFAAIAASGDVNVNAIAPGISAALLATVAGLGVAIPALFGYNYILTRNKAVQANMQVFADEFLMRASETYGEQAFARAAAAE